jgi:hypothetical protein
MTARVAIAVALFIAGCGGHTAGTDGTVGDGGKTATAGSGGAAGSGGTHSTGGAPAAEAGGVPAAAAGGAQTASGGRPESACVYRTDCASPLLCRDMKCVTQCEVTRDCPSGQECVFHGNLGGCQLLGVTKCILDSDCEQPLVCLSGVCENDPACAVPAREIYHCAPRPRQPTDCASDEPVDAGDIGYPLGCDVDLPRINAASSCGPQTCTCSQFVGSGPPTWICAE